MATIDDLAVVGASPLLQAIAWIEGFGQSSDNRPTRNNNPLDLIHAGQPGVVATDGPFAVFGSLDDGVSAGDAQIAKWARLHPDWDLYDLATKILAGDPETNTPAPGNQGNADEYGATLVSRLGVTDTTTLSQIVAGSPGSPDTAASSTSVASAVSDAVNTPGVKPLAIALVVGGTLLVVLSRA